MRGQAPLSSTPHLFDRHLLKDRRNHVATSYCSYDFLKKRTAVDLAQRLKFIRRTFQRGVDIGCHTGQLGTALRNALQIPLIAGDLSEAMVGQVKGSLKVVLDEEALPFAQNSLDLVTSALSLHWVNDLPGFLAQVHQCLKPDGLFLASLLGGATLVELRDCLSCAELALQGGVTPRLSPMLSLQEAGTLLQRAGFMLPVVDHDLIQVAYPHPRALLHDLRHMGENNALYNRSRRPLPRQVLRHAFDLYHERYSLPNGQILATFDIITLTGWAPQ